MRFAIPILIAALVAAWAGYRAMRLQSVRATIPRWVWIWFWVSVAVVLVMVPILWWLDF